MKAELREARMEAEPLEESGRPRPPREPPVNTMDGFIRSEEGITMSQPVPHPAHAPPLLTQVSHQHDIIHMSESLDPRGKSHGHGIERQLIR